MNDTKSTDFLQISKNAYYLYKFYDTEQKIEKQLALQKLR